MPPASKKARKSLPAGLRVGLYGGSFDPVHSGHLIGARDALEQLSLDLLYWVPCAQSPHKEAATSASGAERAAMVAKAIRGEKRFRLSRIELGRKGPSYAIDTVEAFEAAHPGAALYFLIGADQLPHLGAWRRFAELRRRVTFLVMDRPGNAARRLPRGAISLPRPRQIDISATEIRARLKQKLPIAHLVPASVASHIAKKRLYQGPPL